MAGQSPLVQRASEESCSVLQVNLQGFAPLWYPEQGVQLVLGEA